MIVYNPYENNYMRNLPESGMNRILTWDERARRTENFQSFSRAEGLQ